MESSQTRQRPATNVIEELFPRLRDAPYKMPEEWFQLRRGDLAELNPHALRMYQRKPEDIAAMAENFRPYTRPDPPSSKPEDSTYYVQPPFTAVTKPKDGSPDVRVQPFIQLIQANNGNRKSDGTEGWGRWARSEKQKNGTVTLGPRPRQKFFVCFVYFDQDGKVRKVGKDAIEGPYSYAETFRVISDLAGSRLFPQFFIEVFFEVYAKGGVSYEDIVKSVYKNKPPPADILDPIVDDNTSSHPASPNQDAFNGANRCGNGSDLHTHPTQSSHSSDHGAQLPPNTPLTPTAPQTVSRPQDDAVFGDPSQPQPNVRSGSFRTEMNGATQHPLQLTLSCCSESVLGSAPTGCPLCEPQIHVLLDVVKRLCKMPIKDVSDPIKEEKFFIAGNVTLEGSSDLSIRISTRLIETRIQTRNFKLANDWDGMADMVTSRENQEGDDNKREEKEADMVYRKCAALFKTECQQQIKMRRWRLQRRIRSVEDRGKQQIALKLFDVVSQSLDSIQEEATEHTNLLESVHHEYRQLVRTNLANKQCGMSALGLSAMRGDVEVLKIHVKTMAEVVEEVFMSALENAGIAI